MRQILKKLAKLLVMIGALNWGSIGLLNKDLVELAINYISPQQAALIIRATYVSIGAAAVILMLYPCKPGECSNNKPNDSL